MSLLCLHCDVVFFAYVEYRNSFSNNLFYNILISIFDYQKEFSVWLLEETSALSIKLKLGISTSGGGYLNLTFCIL